MQPLISTQCCHADDSRRSQLQPLRFMRFANLRDGDFNHLRTPLSDLPPTLWPTAEQILLTGAADQAGTGKSNDSRVQANANTDRVTQRERIVHTIYATRHSPACRRCLNKLVWSPLTLSRTRQLELSDSDLSRSPQISSRLRKITEVDDQMMTRMRPSLKSSYLIRMMRSSMTSSFS